MQQEWNQKILLTFPPFLLIQFFFQNNKGESQYSNFSTAQPTVVSKSFCNIIFTTFPILNVSR